MYLEVWSGCRVAPHGSIVSSTCEERKTGLSKGGVPIIMKIH